MALRETLRRLVGGGRTSGTAEDGVPPRAAAGPVRVLVAQFGGDDSGAVQGNLVSRLSHRSALQVAALPRPVTTAAEPLKRIEEAVKVGRNALEKAGGEVLVWGEAAGSALRLRFVTRPPATDYGSGAAIATEHLDLPLYLSDEQADVAELMILAAARPLEDEVRKARVDALRTAQTAGLRVVKNGGLPEACLPALKGWLANLELHPSLRNEGMTDVELAAGHYRGALAHGAEVLGEPMIAALRGHLGAAVAAVASERRDAEAMDEAAMLVRAASAVITREALPDEYAALQGLLGWILQRQGTLANRTNYLREAVAAYQLACSVWTRGANPTRWAEMQVNIGRLLTTLGEFTHTKEFLDQAVTVFRQVAGVYTREKAPVFWANLQNNIGAALFAKSKHTNDAADLTAAAFAYKEALAVYEERQITKSMHVAKKNLQRVERLVQMRAAAAQPATKQPAG
ncbi:hypothetical protein [Caenispirillum bisanense]|uniref:Tetratricopeptide repeat-containing protein n=1 Tax=Caenispirillum bisanense TaxID=414052 RepID=A0A286GUQ7_9PROT|nr:hypothetical protein [Caenispirillum bisanense]SOD98906.1 hypothetical protein SAMN05421508_108134 [Caenispirillum bisanense]